MEAAITILAITIVLAIVVKILQRKLVDQKKIKSLQAQMKEDNKRYFSLIKEGEKNKKEIDELHQRIMKTQMEVMNSSMKLNFVILPVFLIALWGLGFLFGSKIIESIIPLPTFVGFTLWNPATWIPNGIGMTGGYYKVYFFYYIIATILILICEKIYDTVRHPEKAIEKKREAEEKKTKEKKAEEEKNKIMNENKNEVKAEEKIEGSKSETVESTQEIRAF